ncbi:hypothetical protein HN748_03685 [Candidatus Peregrinibacteria bacterium]|jgi:hypothetical protein|nr:hypothetical protein [Candidatus Peregrinibacteria bacterium]MBT7484598.1 hypothetical protein [Candidatus Peregrinibacteria bacterium]MBT7703310.1 hypothetical protein [Candidatus Peregrinibacteria bacterium]
MLNFLKDGPDTDDHGGAPFVYDDYTEPQVDWFILNGIPDDPLEEPSQDTRQLILQQRIDLGLEAPFDIKNFKQAVLEIFGDARNFSDSREKVFTCEVNFGGAWLALYLVNPAPGYFTACFDYSLGVPRVIRCKDEHEALASLKKHLHERWS